MKSLKALKQGFFTASDSVVWTKNQQQDETIPTVSLTRPMLRATSEPKRKTGARTKAPKKAKWLFQM